MEILLRKAASLATAATLAASNINLEPTTALSVYTADSQGAEIANQIASNMRQESADLAARIDQVLALHRTVYEIRLAVGNANSKQVNALLTERRFLDTMEKILHTIIIEGSKLNKSARRSRFDSSINIDVAHDANAVAQAIQNIKGTLATITNGLVPDVEYPTLDKERMAQLTKQLSSVKRRKSDLNDELAAANLIEKIKLSDHAVTVLRKHGIIE